MGKINWNGGSSFRQNISYDILINSNEFENIQDYNNTQQDSLLESFITDDSVFEIDTLTSTLPLLIDIESEFLINNRILLYNSIIYEGKSTVNPFSSLEFGGGIKFMPHRRIPVTIGVSHNSKFGLKWGGGFGLNLNHYHFNISVAQIGGFKNDGKGISLNIINYLYF